MEAKQVLEVTCPDCRGPLSRVAGEEVPEYRCLIGHIFSAKAVLEAHCDAQERVLWAAVVVLEETANLVEKVAEQFPPEVRALLKEQARTKVQQAAQIRGILERLEPFQLDDPPPGNPAGA